jgi:hypothetical protein
MIVFRCPYCHEEMEISSRKRGDRVRCVECGKWVQVPEHSAGDDPGLSSGEYWLFALLFLPIPAVNVLVSSILYYLWVNDRPRRARQINTLGFIIFGLHIVLGIAFLVLRAALAK